VICIPFMPTLPEKVFKHVMILMCMLYKQVIKQHEMPAACYFGSSSQSTASMTRTTEDCNQNSMSVALFLLQCLDIIHLFDNFVSIFTAHQLSKLCNRYISYRHMFVFLSACLFITQYYCVNKTQAIGS